jgi:hypothetical protein
MSSTTRANLIGLISPTGQTILQSDPLGNPFKAIFGRPVVINEYQPAIAATDAATDFDSEQIFAFDVSPDNRLAISRGSRVNDVVLSRMQDEGGLARQLSAIARCNRSVFAHVTWGCDAPRNKSSSSPEYNRRSTSWQGCS